MSDLHFHCLLQRGTTKTVGWIEQRGAVVGKRVQIVGDDDGLWDVIEVHGPPRTLTSLKESEKRTRRGFFLP